MLAKLNQSEVNSRHDVWHRGRVNAEKLSATLPNYRQAESPSLGTTSRGHTTAGLFLNGQDRNHRNPLHASRHPEAIQAKGHPFRTSQSFRTQETDAYRCEAREHPIHQISDARNLPRLQDISNRNMSGWPSGLPADTAREDIQTHRPREMENDCPLTAAI